RPSVTARNHAEVEFHRLRIGVNGSMSFDRECATEPAIVAEQQTDFAVCAVRSDEETSAELAIGCAQNDFVRALLETDNIADNAEVRSSSARLPQAEVVELRANRHHRDRMFAPQRAEVSKIARDMNALRDGSNHRFHVVTKRLNGLDGQRARARFHPRKLTLVEQQD